MGWKKLTHVVLDVETDATATDVPINPIVRCFVRDIKAFLGVPVIASCLDDCTPYQSPAQAATGRLATTEEVEPEEEPSASCLATPMVEWHASSPVTVEDLEEEKEEYKEAATTEDVRDKWGYLPFGVFKKTYRGEWCKVSTAPIYSPLWLTQFVGEALVQRLRRSRHSVPLSGPPGNCWQVHEVPADQRRLFISRPKDERGEAQGGVRPAEVEQPPRHDHLFQHQDGPVWVEDPRRRVDKQPVRAVLPPLRGEGFLWRPSCLRHHH